jgi:sulfur-oxidizing protein SoxY
VNPLNNECVDAQRRQTLREACMLSIRVFLPAGQCAALSTILSTTLSTTLSATLSTPLGAQTTASGLRVSTDLSSMPAATRSAMLVFTNNQLPSIGGIQIEIAELVENGHAVPITVRVDGAAAATKQLKAIAIFTEQNPQAEVAVFQFAGKPAKPQLSTRIRLATTQRLWVVARMTEAGDAAKLTYIAQPAQVIVTLAACIEG